MSKIDMLLALNGSRQGAIRGESIISGHEQEIELLGWTWGMLQEVNPVANKATKASGRALTFNKKVDSSSTPIMSAIKSAEIISSATLTCRDAGGPKPIDFLKIKLSNARICSYEIMGQVDSEDRHVQESFSLAFKNIEVVYTPKSNANAKSGACTFVDQYE